MTLEKIKLKHGSDKWKEFRTQGILDEKQDDETRKRILSRVQRRKVRGVYQRQGSEKRTLQIQFVLV